MMPNSRKNFGHPVWIRQRELRQRLPLGYSDAFYKGLYSTILRCDSRESPGFAMHRGIYSMDFSPDGCLLVTTCNRSGIQMYDPLSRNVIATVSNAHRGRVKKVKFLDSRTFATGSADMSVALWDVRNLKEELRTLRGHSNIVCDIEFSSKNNVLVTCGGDGIIHTWNLHSFAEESVRCRKVFGSHDFLHMQLTPDASKMIISSSRGYLLIVHDLDLNTLAEDLAGYDPGACPFYHLQQMVACGDVDVFSRSRRRNRLEPVTDFPLADGCSEATALQVHPDGDSALSRTIREESPLHWLSVHDIRDRGPAGGGDEGEDEEVGEEGEADVAMDWRGGAPPEPTGRDELHEQGEGNRVQSESATTAILGSMATVALRSGQSSGGELHRAEQGESRRRDLQESPGASTPAPQPETEEEVGNHAAASSPNHPRPVRHTVPRLTHFVEGKNIRIWNSEELCFSPDGRLICSPFQQGIKLYTFSPECHGQFVAWSGGEPIILHEFAMHNYHDTPVISTKFSPRHCLIVSGCLRGKINWYQPLL